MKRLIYIGLCALTLLSSVDLSARSHLEDAPIYKENYSWHLTDASQKKQSIGMVVTGIVFFFLIGIVSGAIEPSTDGKAAPFTGGETANTIL